MNKQSYEIQSGYFCKCGKAIKMNLFSKKNRKDLLCYKCHRISIGRPAQHVPRRKRLDAGLPVHN